MWDIFREWYFIFAGLTMGILLMYQSIKVFTDSPDLKSTLEIIKVKFDEIPYKISMMFSNMAQFNKLLLIPGTAFCFLGLALLEFKATEYIRISVATGVFFYLLYFCILIGHYVSKMFINISKVYVLLTNTILAGFIMYLSILVTIDNHNNISKFCLIFIAVTININYIWMITTAAEKLDVFDKKQRVAVSTKYKIMIIFYLTGVLSLTTLISTFQFFSTKDILGVVGVDGNINYNTNVINALAYCFFNLFPSGTSDYFLSKNFVGKAIYLTVLIYKFLLITVFLGAVIRFPLFKKNDTKDKDD